LSRTDLTDMERWSGAYRKDAIRLGSDTIDSDTIREDLRVLLRWFGVFHTDKGSIEIDSNYLSIEKLQGIQEHLREYGIDVSIPKRGRGLRKYYTLYFPQRCARALEQYLRISLQEIVDNNVEC
jgi:hypothetical protein